VVKKKKRKINVFPSGQSVLGWDGFPTVGLHSFWRVNRDR
jgi:hypothetical protein